MCVALVVALASSTRAGEDSSAKIAGSPTRERADATARAVVAALATKDARAILAAFSTWSAADGWLMADAILALGDSASARALADSLLEISADVDHAALRAYVVSRDGKEDDSAVRRAVDAGEDAITARDADTALRVLDPVAAHTDGVSLVRLHQVRAAAYLTLERRASAATERLAAGDVAASIGWHSKAMGLYERGGRLAFDLYDYEKALSAWQRFEASANALRVDDRAADALSGVLAAFNAMSRYREAIEAGGRLPSYETGPRRRGSVWARRELGLAYAGIGNDASAHDCFERALTHAVELGLQPEAAQALSDLGNTHASAGRFDEALACYTRALESRRALGLEGEAATTLGSIGDLHSRRGEYAKALEVLEQALAIKEKGADRANIAAGLGNIALVHVMIGNYERALLHHTRSLELWTAIGDRARIAIALDNIGNTHYRMRHYAKALEFHEKALTIEEQIGDREGIEWTLGNFGLVHAALGRQALVEGRTAEGRKSLTASVEYHERALAIATSRSNAVGTARSLEKLGRAHAALGDSSAASSAFERALAVAETLRSDRILFDVLEAFAAERLRSGDARSACALARRATELLPTLAGGLGDEQGASARSVRTSIFGIGTTGAVRAGDVAEAAYFIESGRAGTLIEALGGRRGIQAASLPADLVAAESRARAEVAHAQERYAKTVSTGDRARLGSAAKVLEDAQGRLSTVTDKIQRTAKREAGVLYAKADPLETIARPLAKGEVFVEYALCEPEAFALVVTRAGGRIVSLGARAAITDACGAFRCDGCAEDPRPALAALARALVRPLELAPDVRRVLISPEGPLCYLPFCALLPDLEVAYVPSGTTHGLLREESAMTGVGILALGDADYGDAREALANRERGGRRLVRLPATRDEAMAIGDVLLLGSAASEAGFRAALERRPRWHAIHFACHGILDVDRPMFSALALSRTASDDGFLTAEEVLRTRVPADLVVLSACETSKGKIVDGEGILGLTRAFMLAGSPRVICSLWKVDDEATGLLMTRFYALWSPKDGSQSLHAAAALRAAQTYVRDLRRNVVDVAASQAAGHEVRSMQAPFAHPTYWAAWVLWGLPD